MNALLGAHGISDILFSGGAIVPLLLGAALWELMFPEHSDVQPFVRRWISNYSLMAMSVALNTLLAPSLAFLTNLVLARSPLRWAPGQFGFWIHLAYALLVLDALTYAVHRTFHAVPALWRLHALYHSDVSLDVSTTVRHHPGEAVVTALVVGVGGAVLGCSAIEVVVYGVLENVVQLLGHADVRLPGFVERLTRRIFVTPKFHRIHHSSRRSETDSNYGQVFAFWDSLFGSYGGSADEGRGPIEYGLQHFRDARSQRLDQTLLLPFQVGRPD
jgi:sterol desaturase/sphingolipid hydroxylase (fatty acid hydroxylase superfamily)